MPNFAIFGRMRSGSSLLCSYLDSHSQISCDFELLHRKRYDGTPLGTRRHIKDCIDKSEKPVFGFKVLYHQMWGMETTGFHIIKEVLHSFDLKFIHIIRRNKLESYVSQLLAKQSQIWNAFDNKNIDKHFVRLTDTTIETYNQPISVSPVEFERYKRRSTQWEQAIAQNYDCLQIFYEDLPDALPNVLEYIGVEREELTCETVKLRVKPLSELIINYDELHDIV